MLRSLKHPHLGGLLRAFQVTTAGSAATVDVGAGDAPSAALANTSTATLSPYRTPNRAGIRLVQAAANIANGGYGIYLSDPAISSVVARTLGASGSADAGTSYVLALDYTNEFTDRIAPLQSVRNTARSPRLMAFRIAAAGTVTIGGTQATVSVTSSVYTVTFTKAFGRNCMAWANPIAAAQKAARVTATSESTATIATFDSSEAAEDNAFDLLVLGWDSIDEQWGNAKVIQTPQLKPRIEAYRISGSGTAALALGDVDGTLTDNGTGDYSVAFAQAFARAPMVFATGKAGRVQLAAAASSSSMNLLAFGATGSAADDDICALVVGFDSADEK